MQPKVSLQCYPIQPMFKLTNYDTVAKFSLILISYKHKKTGVKLFLLCLSLFSSIFDFVTQLRSGSNVSLFFLYQLNAALCNVNYNFVDPVINNLSLAYSRDWKQAELCSIYVPYSLVV